MTKILFIPEFGEFGGTRTYFETFVSFCRENKIDIVVVLEKGKADECAISFLKEKGCGIRFVMQRSICLGNIWQRFPFNLFFDIFSIFPIYLKEKTDMVVVSNGTLPLYLGVVFFAKRFAYIAHSYPRKKMPFPYRWIVGIFIDGKRKIILTVSEFSKKKIMQYCAGKRGESVIKVAYNTIGNIELKSQSEKEGSISKIILTLGHVEWYKNPFYWIKIARKISELMPSEKIEFVWAGDGKLLNECKKQVEKLQLANVKFIGYQQNVASLFENCYLYFQPSRVESFGLSVAEAQGRGIPCVVSNRGGLPELIHDEKNGLVIDLEDYEKDAEKIVSLILDKKKYDDISLNARKYYNDNFSYGIWDKKMQILINDILQA